jgi:hypothetical protein
MESHKRILGILFTISGILRIFGASICMALFSFIFPLILQEVSSDEAWIVDLIQSSFQLIIWIFILFFSLPRLIAGIGLLNKKSWALMMALIWGCLGVFSFPLGTALCGYTIWVYIEENKAKRAVV